MTAWWPAAVLALVVFAVRAAGRAPQLCLVFRWLPVPLWCYLLPSALVAAGVLPAGAPAYPLVTAAVLPAALALLLFGTNVPAIVRMGGRAAAAGLVGAAGIFLGTLCATALCRPLLPPEAWKAAASLTATWTGGTMNLLAMRDVLATPEALFAPLILVDAVVAYSWMALLVAGSAHAQLLNRWLRADVGPVPAPAASSVRASTAWSSGALLAAVAAVAVSIASRWAAEAPPMEWLARLAPTASGRAVLLVTTVGLAASLAPRIRAAGEAAGPLGSTLLLLVLTAAGAQASLHGLMESPVWLAFGAITVTVHGGLMLLAGRWRRWPLGLLATASQANIGGVVSAPLVGAVYEQSLVPVGLVLAMAGNATGTYIGLVSAQACRWLTGG